jgi:hypothetical protein
VTCPGQIEAGLTITIPKFTISHPPHHVKALMLSTETFEAASSFRVRAEMAVEIFGTDANPFGASPADPRLAAGALVVMDPQTGVVLDFFVGNQRICTIYERLPVARTECDRYPAFTLLSDTRVPTSPGEWHAYEVRFDPSSDRAEWWVDGDKVASRDRIGAPPGGSGRAVKLRGLRIGGGLFTLVDDLRNDLATAEDNARIPGLDPTGQNELFGQGGRVRFRQISVASN